MVFEFKLPDIGEGIHEGEIVEWLVAEGDTVEEDQDIVEVMTDKATVQISSPRAGTIQTLHFQDGETVDVGQVIVTIQVAGEDPSETASKATPDDGAGEQADEAKDPDPTGPATAETEEASPAPATVEVRSTGGNGAPERTPAGILAPPSVRIEARDRGIDLSQIQGSGPAGRIQMDDLEQAGTTQAPAQRASAAAAHGFQLTSIARDDALRVEPVTAPASSPRASAARAKHFQAHFTYVLSVRADQLVRAVEDAQPLAARHEVPVDDEVIVLKAVAQALKKHPRCNALVDEDTGDLIVPEEVHLGVARHTEDGLRLTTVRSAGDQSILGIAEALATGGADPEEATVTVTTLGGLGGYASTPVLVHPQVTGVVVGGLRDVGTYDDEGRLVPGKELTLSFSFDHRYVDGYNGALFAQEVARLLREPSAFLLEAR